MIAKASAIVALIGAIASGIYAADVRYVSQAEYQDFQWAFYKDQIRELRREIREWEDTVGTAPLELELDLQELLDLFCHKYPEDRECR